MVGMDTVMGDGVHKVLVQTEWVGAYQCVGKESFGWDGGPDDWEN